MLADAEEAANADHHGFDVTALVGQQIVDRSEAFVAVVVHVQADHLRGAPGALERRGIRRSRRRGAWWRGQSLPKDFARTRHLPAARKPRGRQRHIWLTYRFSSVSETYWENPSRQQAFHAFDDFAWNTLRRTAVRSRPSKAACRNSDAARLPSRDRPSRNPCRHGTTARASALHRRCRVRRLRTSCCSEAVPTATESDWRPMPRNPPKLRIA